MLSLCSSSHRPGLHPRQASSESEKPELLPSSSIKVEDERLTKWLTFKDKNDSHKYEDYMMRETPLEILFFVLFVASCGWLVTKLTETSTFPTIGLCFSYSPVLTGILYTYAAWVKQHQNNHTFKFLENDIVVAINSVVTRNISLIGNAVVLCSTLGSVAAAMSLAYYTPSDDKTLLRILEYRNFATIIITPVLFPIHSFVVSLLVIPCVIGISIVTSEDMPPLAQFAAFALVLYVINISAKKRFLLQVDLEVTKAALTKAEDEVLKSEAATTEMHHMIGSMTHDLKTPLQAFTFELENLSNDCEELTLICSEDLTVFHKSVEENISQLKLIVSFMTMSINRSLDYTKVSTGIELIPANGPVDLQETTNWIVNSLTHKMGKSLALVAEPLPKTIKRAVLTDKHWLIDNLFCFVSNAQKFTSEGQITIRYALVPLSNECEAQGGHANSPKQVIREEKSGALSSVLPHGGDIRALFESNRNAASSHGLRADVEFDEELGVGASGCASASTGAGGGGGDGAGAGSSSGVHCRAMLRVEVEDSGIGLSQQQKNNLFQPFKQAQRRAGGTGLGLFSLNKRITALGGQCGVRDRLNNQSGSIFWFTIPYVPDASLDEEELSPVSVAAIKTEAEPRGPVDGNFRRILVVDDSVLIQKATKRSLEREGYVVDVADNGYDCLKFINTTEEKQYDLILLDINMPVMDGLETVSRIRALEAKIRLRYEEDHLDVQGKRIGPFAPNVVVGFSGNSDASTRAEAFEAGMDGFFSKPLSPDDLRALSMFMRQVVVGDE